MQGICVNFSKYPLTEIETLIILRFVRCTTCNTPRTPTERSVNEVTNTALLEAAIARSGKKKGYLAQKCGLSLAGFRNCCINKAEFKGGQMQILWKELGIESPTERLAIFFAESVACEATD